MQKSSTECKEDFRVSAPLECYTTEVWAAKSGTLFIFKIRLGILFSPKSKKIKKEYFNQLKPSILYSDVV